MTAIKNPEKSIKNFKKSKKGLVKSKKSDILRNVENARVLTKSGRIAQSVEQGTENPRVPSSILGPATIFCLSAQVILKKYYLGFFVCVAQR